MPNYLNRNLRVPVRCTKCGHTFEKTVGEIQANHAAVCPGCGETLTFDQGQAAFKEVNNGIDDLKRKLKRFGK